MENGDLPTHVFQFVSENIDSVSKLETLLLFQQNPEKEWTVETLCQQLRTNLPWSAKQIDWLLLKSFIRQASEKGRYHYDQGNHDATAIAELAQIYAVRRIAVISLISYRLVKIKEFSDAFLFRTNKDNKDA